MKSYANHSTNILQAPLNSIVSWGGEEKYICLENTVGQRWFFPYKNINAHMSLFQPSSYKGHIVSFILPYIRNNKFLLSLINGYVINLSFNRVFIETVENTFKKKDITYSIFCGSPGKHKKPTILLMSNNHHIGYCKISDNKDVITLFKEEKKTLDYLKLKGVKNIPNIIHCKPLEYSDQTWMLLQTTEREKRVKIAQPTDNRVFEFLEQFVSCTKVKLKYEQTDFYAAIQNLKDSLQLLNDSQKEKEIRDAIKLVENKLKSNESYYSAYHGDLTPWNSFIVNNHLFAFDFEYFKKTYPTYLDFFHYFTQDQIYNKLSDAKKIILNYNKIKHKLQHIQNADFLYTCYLLSTIEFYLNRDKGYANDRIKEIFNIWVQLLKHFSYE